MSLMSQAPLDQNRLLRHDATRLARQWARLQRVDPSRLSLDTQRWQAALDAAYNRFEKRLQTNYSIVYDPDLPIYNHREEILELLANRQTLIVCGETGSGKSTQLPKLCLQAGLFRQGWIGHTQPRRLAARSIANRLAEELDTQLGQVVGFKIRFQDRTEDSSLVKLMTDGILLAEIQRDPLLEAYDCIIVDEAHERSIQIDMLMAYLADLVHRRPELRLIITSATIDSQRFSEHFHDSLGAAPILSIQGRSYPVEIRYRGIQSLADSPSVESDHWLLERLCNAVDELFSEGRGDILAFFPTERDIRDASKRLRGHLTQRGLHNSVEVLPLYARLTEAEQQRIFQPHRQTRIVLATNVAESSLTVPGIRYVIDTGTARVSRYAPRSRVQRLPIEPICQASANQRSGRCGRLGPGIAIRLFDEQDYLSRSGFAQPEIMRCDLAGTILHAKSLKIDDIESLAWLDPPRPDSTREGLQTLREIQAIDPDGSLTQIGRTLANWPVSPRTGRMLLAAYDNGCLHEMLIIASALETQDPRVRPPEFQQAADAAHLRFRDPQSDFLTLLRIWDFYQNLREKLGRSRLEKACRDAFLSMTRLREWGDIHRQLMEQCREAGLSIQSRRIPISDPDATPAKSSQTTPAPGDRFANGYAELHQAILAGLPSGVAMLDDQGKYRGASNMELLLWPGSCLKGSNAKWIVCSEIVETHDRFARTNARIDPVWIEKVLGHCLKFSYDEPHFSRKQGSAMVMRRGSLLGLPAVNRHPVALAPLDPKLARDLLIEHGLAELQLESRAKFWSHNQSFLDQIQRIGDKTRRRDCVVDSFALLNFYRKCIPEHVVDRVSLEQWDKTLKDTKSAPFLSLDSLELQLDPGSMAKEFPDQLEVGPTSRLQLSYRFEPGSQLDGVTLEVPEAFVEQLHQEKLEWLVPGLLGEKIAALLKSLPKPLRRQLVPIPDTVKSLLPKMLDAAARSEPFWKSLCDVCSKHIGQPVQRTDFDSSALPEHLLFRIELKDPKGKNIAVARQLPTIQQAAHLQLDSKPKSDRPTSSITTNYPWQRSNMQAWDIPELPQKIIELNGGVRMERYPSLQWIDSKVSTTIYDHPHLAEQQLRETMIRALAIQERRELKSQIQFLPKWTQCTLWLSDRFDANKLTDFVAQLMVRLALVETNWTKDSGRFEPCPRTLLDWESRRVGKVQKIGTATVELARWLPKFAEAYQQIRRLKESLPKPLWEPPSPLRAQLDGLMDPAHALHTPWLFVKDIPRFLNALALRIEKLRTIGAPKDQQSDLAPANASKDFSKRIAELESQLALAKHQLKWHPDGNLLDYRWMIEEFRVSIHAQKLGTRMSVSPKRIEKLQEQLQAEPNTL
ncbi:MAG: ATP-dependent RNA helicase HrpA [Planctomycetota bacterium]|nr:ATP-dependent RNA helicase HrpA [Planctomycetota bacterium]